MNWHRRRQDIETAGQTLSVEELEWQEQRAQREADESLTRRIAAAECASLGHVEPEDGPLADTVDILPWGSLTPIRVGPHCTRCGANLAEQDK